MPVQKKPHYDHLKNKWTNRHQKLHEKLWSKHKESLSWLSDNTKHLAVGSLGSLMLLAGPVTTLLPAPHISSAHEIGQVLDKTVFLVSDLLGILPKEVRALTNEEEEKIGKVLSRNFGFKVTAELEGKRLNRSYGLIGAEQHLARFRGDTMDSHFDNDEEAKLHWSSGMAPGLGGWGYFMDKGEQQLSEKGKLREKYYIAVQTFLAPGFDKNPREIIDFFRFRKMLVVNPQNGKAVVAVVGDAGPSPWTGKHLGGSPEVMDYLERVDGAQKGPVLYFFIDDPQDKIPLGPISYN
ncbi:hypothetical protein C4559_05665 [Candidatus Microgenomates bacterium]|nr:MAG: hypothetical protein C4559_05665 [Candidatus Microgenomates bacterium]